MNYNNNNIVSTILTCFYGSSNHGYDSDKDGSNDIDDREE